jgi:hypothetical protein
MYGIKQSQRKNQRTKIGVRKRITKSISKIFILVIRIRKWKKNLRNDVWNK